jgi:hypothetical protein
MTAGLITQIGQPDQRGMAILRRRSLAQTLDAPDFVLVPAGVVLVGMRFVRPPAAVSILGQELRPLGNLFLRSRQAGFTHFPAYM